MQQTSDYRQRTQRLKFSDQKKEEDTHRNNSSNIDKIPYKDVYLVIKFLNFGVSKTK